MWKTKQVFFKCDNLSPFLICQSIDPLNWLLNFKNEAYNSSQRGNDVQKVGHLLYVDDLKLYAVTDNILKK